MNITLSAVSFRYPGDVVALRDVNLSIQSGQSVALIGENGAGKTTLAKHLNGLLQPEAGRVIVGDWDATEHSVAELAARVGFVFQNPDDQLFARKVWDEVAFGPRNLGLLEEEIKANVETALTRVDLAAESETHPYDLSASERKLLSIATILAMDTEVVILDEPTTGQDARGVAIIGRIVEDLKSAGRTVITITHDIEFCADHFQRVIVMAGGEIIADGPAVEVLSQHALLQQSKLEAPQMVRLALALSLKASPLTVEDFVRAFKEQFHGRYSW
jgi:energy-coupling factor transport system ATP-binding protein